MDEQEPRILSLETAHRGFSTFMLAQVRLKDGAEVRREIEHHGDAVGLLAYDPRRRSALLIRLFRVAPLYLGLEPERTEVPAGLVDPGETPDAAAKREALEETGVSVDALERVATVWSCPALSTERVTLYLAPCSLEGRVGGGGKDGEHENITVLEVPLRDLALDAAAGRIGDHKLLILIQALQLRRPDLFD